MLMANVSWPARTITLWPVSNNFWSSLSFVLLLRSVTTLFGENNTPTLCSLVILHKICQFCFQFSILKPNVQKIVQNLHNILQKYSKYRHKLVQQHFYDSTDFFFDLYLLSVTHLMQTPPNTHAHRHTDNPPTQSPKNTYSSNPTLKNKQLWRENIWLVCSSGFVLNVFSAGVIPLHCCSFTEH